MAVEGSNSHQLDVICVEKKSAIKEFSKIEFENVRLLRCLATSELSLKVIEM